MWLTVISLVIAGASALFGIWSAKDIETSKAAIASIVTILGIVIGIVVAWNERRSSAESARLEETRHAQVDADLERQREDLEGQRQEAIARERATLAQFRALQTSLQLNSLEIVWRIPDAPDHLKDAIYLAEAIFESY